MESALEIQSGLELEHFDLGKVVINHTHYTVLTGYEGTGLCFWCGGELKGKLKRYCRGHMQEYYKHFDWQSASYNAQERAGYKCENCGIASKDIPTIGYDMRSGLEVHHIVPLKGESRQFTAFNLPWNLIVLCHDCHMELHRIMRPPKKTEIPDSWDEATKRGQSIMAIFPG